MRDAIGPYGKEILGWSVKIRSLICDIYRSWPFLHPHWLICPAVVALPDPSCRMPRTHPFPAWQTGVCHQLAFETCRFTVTMDTYPLIAKQSSSDIGQHIHYELMNPIVLNGHWYIILNQKFTLNCDWIYIDSSRSYLSYLIHHFWSTMAEPFSQIQISHIVAGDEQSLNGTAIYVCELLRTEMYRNRMSALSSRVSSSSSVWPLLPDLNSASKNLAINSAGLQCRASIL